MPVSQMSFSHPSALAVGIAIILLYFVFRVRRSQSATVLYSGASGFANIPPTPRQLLARCIPFFNAGALLLGFIALSRPHIQERAVIVPAEGIDIALIVDTTGTMQMRDYYPDRLEVAKQAAVTFVEGRQHDRFTLIVFGPSSYTLVPATTDRQLVIQFIQSIYHGIVPNHATAIGDVLAYSARTLRNSELSSQVIVLVTDGENNYGRIDPLVAAQIAQAFGIRVYIIGIMGQRAESAQRGWRTDVLISADYEKVMREIAETTGGVFFPVQNPEGFLEVFAEIDRLEKSEIEDVTIPVKRELFHYFLASGLGLLLLARVASGTLCQSLPE